MTMIFLTLPDWTCHQCEKCHFSWLICHNCCLPFDFCFSSFVNVAVTAVGCGCYSYSSSGNAFRQRSQPQTMKVEMKTARPARLITGKWGYKDMTVRGWQLIVQLQLFFCIFYYFFQSVLWCWTVLPGNHLWVCQLWPVQWFLFLQL